MSQLKNLRECPFCGGEAEHEIFDDGFFAWGRVECKQCGAMLTTPPKTVIEAWNNRATEAEIREKAYERFMKEIEAEYDNDACPNVTDYLDYKISLRDLFRIADELKGGAD